MKRQVLLIVIVLLYIGEAYSQDVLPKLQNYHPVTPSVFEFTKYTDIPVSEYTGIPNISVPLYTLEVDEVKVPINLTYHAGGIRVTQEASWVGLGWDLTFGSIVQEINDVDDYSAYTNVVRLRPDYKWNPYPTYFPTKYTYPNCLFTTGAGWVNPYPIESYDGKYSFMISTANWIPINGDYDNQQLGQKILSFQEYDSEPDIFTANFLGHSLKFCRNFPNGGITLLNQKGYKVSRIGDAFKIITPNGEEFHFEIHSDIITQITTDGGIIYTHVQNYEPNSKVWYLTKIITKNKRTIQFNYAQTPQALNYPSVSQRFDKLTNPVTNYHNLTDYVNVSNFESFGLPNGPLVTEAEYLTSTISQSTETRFYLNSISFPLGSINFVLSSRSDILEGKKLDSINVNTTKLLKQFTFNYSYFDATSVNGGPLNQASYGNTGLYRLKLMSVDQNDGTSFSFSYNGNSLPPKNSFAQDYWGFYNGALANTSLVPNPVRLNISGMSDNGNNNSANLNYAQSGVLTELFYPTGGKATFEYELNTFSNYWVPDFETATNTFSTGNGLRIKEIKLYTSDNQIAKRTSYSYMGGKDPAGRVMFRNFSFSNAKNDIENNTPNPQRMFCTSYSVLELDGKGFFSSNSLGSANCVGYDKVIKQEIDQTGQDNGRIETEYNNSIDQYYSSAALPPVLGATLPNTKHPTFSENGTVNKISYYKDNSLSPVKVVQNLYITVKSDLLYGARIFGYPILYIPFNNCESFGNTIPYWEPLPQYLIGFYPIFDKQSLLVRTETTTFDDPVNPITTVQGTSYNNYHLPSVSSVISSKQSASFNHQRQIHTSYAAEGTQLPNPMLLANRLLEPMQVFKREVKGPSSFYPHYYDHDKVTYEYESLADKVVKSRIEINNHPGAGEYPAIITFDLYDNFANLLEFTEKGLKKSMLWDYEGEYVTAEVTNAGYTDIGFSSFETGSKGNFEFSGSPISSVTAFTGIKVYNLTEGLISKVISDSKSYKVSLWAKSGTVTVNGLPPQLTGESINGFTYYEWEISHQSQVNIAGNAEIDELRLLPVGAQMSTYTYEPLVGLLSACDINNKVTYYIYDEFYRLKLVKDSKGNILKKMEYQYHQ